MESVLYHYYCMRDGVEYDPCGIRTDAGTMSAEEELDPYAQSYEVSPDFQMPQPKEQDAPYHLPELSLSTDNEVYDWGFQIASDDLMSFVKENGTSPSVAVAMLVGEAVDAVHPDRDAPVVAILPVSIRHMLGCEETFKNCSNRITLPLVGTPLDALPFAERAAQLRGILKQQMNPDLWRSVANMQCVNFTTRMKEATDYWEDIKKPSALLTIFHDTFYVDYIGRLRTTAYSDKLVDVRFLCKPPAGKTLHVNVIDHGGSSGLTVWLATT